ncbi:MAG: hypothetical protein KDA78_17240 [Planctomycetaceae bacterium]|nr:hypothetical protein [Planctomycetaceae bacterium]
MAHFIGVQVGRYVLPGGESEGLMRFLGERVGGEVRRVVRMPREDGEDWEMEIRPLRLSFHRVLRERGIVAPSAPTRVSRDAQGHVLRDGDGLVVLQRDESDRGYLSGMELYHQRVAAMIVWESLQGDSRYEFETKKPGEGENWERFADELLIELEQSGWSVGDVLWFCEQVGELSRMTGEHVREGRARFF